MGVSAWALVPRASASIPRSGPRTPRQPGPWIRPHDQLPPPAHAPGLSPAALSVRAVGEPSSASFTCGRGHELRDTALQAPGTRSTRGRPDPRPSCGQFSSHASRMRPFWHPLPGHRTSRLLRALHLRRGCHTTSVHRMGLRCCLASRPFTAWIRQRPHVRPGCSLTGHQATCGKQRPVPCRPRSLSPGHAHCTPSAKCFPHIRLGAGAGDASTPRLLDEETGPQTMRRARGDRKQAAETRSGSRSARGPLPAGPTSPTNRRVSAQTPAPHAAPGFS